MLNLMMISHNMNDEANDKHDVALAKIGVIIISSILLFVVIALLQKNYHNTNIILQSEDNWSNAIFCIFLLLFSALITWMIGVPSITENKNKKHAA